MKIEHLLLVLVLALLLAPGLASAEPTEADRATARELAKEAHAALVEKDYTRAEERFRRANELFPAPTLLVGLARARVGLGKLVEAYEAYQEVVRGGERTNVPWAWQRAYKEAKIELADVEERLAWVTLDVVGPESFRVLLDGQEYPSAAVGVRRATNPGTRDYQVEAEGFHDASQTLELEEGESAELTIELEPKPLDEATLPAVDEPGDAAIEFEEEPEAESVRWPAYAALGAGAVGLGVGTYFGIRALDSKGTLDDRCPLGQCPSTQEGILDEYRTQGLISTIGFAAGVVGAGVGLTLLLVQDDEAPQRDEAALRLLVGPNSAQLRGVF